MSTAPRAVRTSRVRLLGAAGLLVSLLFVAQGPAVLVGLARAQQIWLGQGDGPVMCTYRASTGRPCLGCGGTRALGLAARGHWRAAVDANPMGAWAGAAAWAALVCSTGVLVIGRAPRARVPLMILITSALAAFLVTCLWWWLQLKGTLVPVN